MVEIQPRANAFALIFSEAECLRLGLDKGKEYELTKAGNGIWVLVEGNIAAAKNQASMQQQVAKQQTPAQPPMAIDEMEHKIIGLLRKTTARDRIEGWFEKKLTEEEKKKFGEMLTQGKVVRYKSSEAYRKSLYTLPAKSAVQEKVEKKFENKEKPIEEFSLEQDGFLVVKNEMRAKALSNELAERIKSGEIRGIRSFSGEFFIISSDLLISSQEKALAALRAMKSGGELSALCEKTGFTPTLVRIAMEFLKEEGQIIEKRKGIYQYIE